MYEAGARVAEWIKEGGDKQDKRVWAAVEGVKACTTAYIAAEKERAKEEGLEEQKGTRGYRMLTTRVQELVNDLGMDAVRPHTYTETAAQTEGVVYTGEDMERLPR